MTDLSPISPFSVFYRLEVAVLLLKSIDADLSEDELNVIEHWGKADPRHLPLLEKLISPTEGKDGFVEIMEYLLPRSEANTPDRQFVLQYLRNPPGS